MIFRHIEKWLVKMINEANGSMSMEGMPLTEADKDRMRRCVGNDKLVEETIAELVRKHTVAKGYIHE